MKSIFYKEEGGEEIIKIKQKVIFTFAILNNAREVAIALSSAGYYVRITSSSSGYVVYVYTDRI